MATRKHSKLKTYLQANFTEFEQEENSDRLNALYSDFSKLSLLNKYAYDSNVNYWRRVILDCNQQGYLGSSEHALVIDQNAIAEKFQRPIIGKPLALDCVIENMSQKNELLLLDEFNRRYSPPGTWLNWIFDTVVRNTWQWRWRNDIAVQQAKQYVVLPTIKSISKAIISHHFQQGHATKATDHILTLTQFKSLYATRFINEIELTDSDISLVLKYLHSQHGVALADNVKGYGTSYMVIKFPSRENEIANITQHDEAVISIRTTCHALSVQVDELQKKSEELQKQSLEEKKQGHTSKALYCLKRRKNLLEILDRRLKSMETMDNVLMKIETSQDDLQVVQAFNMGADALRDLLGEDGLTLELVDDTMEKIQNAFQDQKEIEEALHMGNEELANDYYSEQDMEDELSELIQQEASLHTPTPAPKIIPQNNANINSELSRLNQMFSSVKSVPVDSPATASSSFVKEKELA